MYSSHLGDTSCGVVEIRTKSEAGGLVSAINYPPWRVGLNNQMGLRMGILGWCAQDSDWPCTHQKGRVFKQRVANNKSLVFLGQICLGVSHHDDPLNVEYNSLLCQALYSHAQHESHTQGVMSFTTEGSG